MTEKLSEKNVYASAINAYGWELQAIVAIEELAELQKEITKALRGKENKLHIAEELADVEIVCEQIKMIFYITDEMVQAVKKKKIKRLLYRINTGNKAAH